MTTPAPGSQLTINGDERTLAKNFAERFGGFWTMRITKTEPGTADKEFEATATIGPDRANAIRAEIERIPGLSATFVKHRGSVDGFRMLRVEGVKRQGQGLW